MADSIVEVARAGEVDPIAARMFARRFPGVQLMRLGAHMRTTCTEPIWLCFEGHGDLLLGLGLLEPAMVPPKPKRQVSDTFSQGEWKEDVYVQRKAKGRIYARRELSQSLPADHPLAFLAPYNFPYADTFEEKRDQFLADFEDSTRFILGCVRALPPRSFFGPGLHGLQFDEATQSRISAVFSAFDTDLRAAIATARIQTPKRESRLRLVVDNTRIADHNCSNR